MQHKKISINIDLTDNAAINQIAQADQRPVGYIIRKAISEYIKRHAPKITKKEVKNDN